MDTEASGHSSYLRRAEALIAARRDLFGSTPRQSAPAPGFAAQRRESGASSGQPAGRQLRLPLPRERVRRRARMLR